MGKNVGEATEVQGVFRTTLWALVNQASEDDEAARRRALEELCRLYWPPIYSYIRRQGNSSHDAQDLTQGFFEHLLTHNTIGRANMDRGRFRSFLLGAVKRYLSDQRTKALAQKRGGQLDLVPFDQTLAESFFERDRKPEVSDEWIFDRRWARIMVERALGSIREDLMAAGQVERFDVLQKLITSARPAEEHEAAAQKLGLTKSAISSALHRLRSSFREALRTEALKTVDKVEDVDEELRYLMKALSVG